MSPAAAAPRGRGGPEKVESHVSQPPVRITVYSKPRCPLCDEAIAQLEALRARHVFELEIVDISTDPSLRARYRMDIPVVAFNGEERFRHRLEIGLLERMLMSSAAGSGGSG